MLKLFLKSRKNVLAYFRNHVAYNATIHVIGGIGVGILIASPLAYPHPVRWGIFLIVVSMVGHIYALMQKK